MSRLNDDLDDMTIITETDRWIANELAGCIDEYAKVNNVDASLYNTYGYVDELLEVIDDNVKNTLLKDCLKHALIVLYEYAHFPTWDCGGGMQNDKLFDEKYRLKDIKVAYEDEIVNGDTNVECFEKYFVDKLNECLEQKKQAGFKRQER